jgi:hypothetical protein
VAQGLCTALFATLQHEDDAAAVSRPARFRQPQAVDFIRSFPWLGSLRFDIFFIFSLKTVPTRRVPSTGGRGNLWPDAKDLVPAQVCVIEMDSLRLIGASCGAYRENIASGAVN